MTAATWDVPLPSYDALINLEHDLFDWVIENVGLAGWMLGARSADDETIAMEGMWGLAFGTHYQCRDITLSSDPEEGKLL